MPPMSKTTQARRKIDAPVTRERCLQVAQAIKEGKIKMPDVAKGKRLLLGDSGSAPNRASHKRQFPGAKLQPHAPGTTPEFLAAHKATFTSDGTIAIDMASQERHDRTQTLDDADATVPIHPLAKLQNMKSV